MRMRSSTLRLLVLRSEVSLLRRVAAVLMVLLGGLAGGCGKQPAGKTAAPGEEPLVIGALFAITGDASSLGIPERDTAHMFQEMVNQLGGINGHLLEIIVEDTKGDADEALAATKRLVEQHEVLAIVGPSRTGTTLAVMDYVEEAQVPLISCAAGVSIVEPVKQWVFKTPQSDRMAIEKIIEHLKRERISRVASLSDTTSFGDSGLQEMQMLLPKVGIRLVASARYGPEDTSMVAQLREVEKAGPQALICWGTPPGAAIVAKNTRQLDMEIPLVCSHGVANQSFIEVAGEAANGVVLPAGRLVVLDQIAPDHPQTRVLEDYCERYRAEFHRTADPFGGYAWDALQLVVKALEAAGPDRAGIRDAIEKTGRFVGATGVFHYSPEDHNGLSKESFVMVEIVEGEWKLVQ